MRTYNIFLLFNDKDDEYLRNTQVIFKINKLKNVLHNL